MAFRVVAPPAIERAAFQEYGCPNARPVVQAEAHDVEHHTSGFSAVEYCPRHPDSRHKSILSGGKVEILSGITLSLSHMLGTQKRPVREGRERAEN
jgi:hypothetical protein